ncbi:YggT family protein [Salinisphaera sp. USBA-960]|nr:YggT family protein [Salifodinibacter halophilus]NNC26961.1 YggT family protein [Salifodinibacter halophilus]
MVNNGMHALIFLGDTLLSLYTIVVLLRVLLQLVRANFYNPLSQFVWQATRIPVRWVAALIPRRSDLDVPALVLAVIICYVDVELILVLNTLAQGQPLDFAQLRPAVALAWAAFKTIVLVCNLYTLTILIQALMSWLAPQQNSPATALLRTLNEPLLRPVRSRLPPLGGFDLSPLVVILVLQVVTMLLPLPGALH